MIFVVSCSIAVYTLTDQSFEKSFRDSAFQIISIVTTTGYISADYTSWSHGLTFFFFFLLFTGACAGSTSGGIKVIRHLVFAKNAILEFKRLLHPRAMIRTKIDRKVVAPRILTHILVFLLVFLGLFVVGTIIMSILLHESDQPVLTAMGAMATSLGNVGPAIGDVGPMDNFADIPPLGKNILCIFMIIGRLELFTVLIIFTPFFWKSN
jgi:trk system potassium uptake protein TrkH